MSFLGGPLSPLFWTSGDVSSVFQSQSGFCLITFCGGKCNVHSLRSTSGTTHTNLLAAGSTVSHFPTCIIRGGTWLGIEWAITWTKDKCATIVPATRLTTILYYNILTVVVTALSTLTTPILGCIIPLV